jgi:hypothetical protein
VTDWQWPEDAIELLRQKLEARLLTTIDGWSVGDAESAKNKACPRVKWVDAQGSKIIPPERSGTQDCAPIGTDEARFACKIWHTSRANVRTMVQNLVAAARDPDIKDSFVWGNYNWTKSSRADNSFELTLYVTIRSLLINQVNPVVVSAGHAAPPANPAESPTTIDGSELEIVTGFEETKTSEPDELVAEDTIEAV